MSVAAGSLAKPKVWDPLLEILRERGRRHENAFVDYLNAQGLSTIVIEGVDITPDAVASTKKAMADGEQIIIQAAL